MARSAVAQETIFALRGEIARIEGTLPERLDAPAAGATSRRNETADRTPALNEAVPERLRTGAQRLDATLKGGLQLAALSEITSTQTRNAGTAAGFALGLATLVARNAPHGPSLMDPVLWIGQGDIFSEAGFPHAPGAVHFFGPACEALFLSETPRLEDALWIAEEAARLGRCAAVLLELRGSPSKLGLTATRRLHRCAALSGRPVFLIREAASAQPTAAPLRVGIAPAASAPRQTLTGAVPQSIGPPAFAVTIEKSRFGPAGPFILEWNAHDHVFRERQDNPGAMVSTPSQRPADAPAVRRILAFEPPRRRTG